MINVGRKDAIFSYISYAVKIVSKVIVIPFILAKVSDDEYALWSVFLSIEGLVALFDMGIAKLVARYATYAYCGVNEIPKEGLPENILDGKTNYILFYEVYYVSKEFYRKIALVTGCVMLGATVYIFHLASDMQNLKSTLIAWIIFSASIAFQIYFTYISSFLKGMGKIKEIQQIDLWSSLLEMVLKIALVFMGLGILGLGIANGLLIMFKRFALNHIFNLTIKGTEDAKQIAERAYKHGECEQVKQAIKKNSKALGGVVLSNYIQNQGTTLLCSMIFTLGETAQYSLTLQFYSVVTSLAQIPYQVFQPKLNEYRLTNDMEKLRDTYSLIYLYMIVLFVCGICGVSFALNPILNILGSNTEVLPIGLAILLGINQFVDVSHRRCTDFIGLGNEQPYAKAYVIASMATILVDIIVLISGHGVFAFILGNLLVQLAYNAWKWPMYVNKMLELKGIEVLTRGVNMVKKILNFDRGK